MTEPSPQADFLMQMAQGSAERLRAARAALPVAKLEQQARSQAPAATLDFSAEGFDLIAEVKKHSPSAGKLAGEQLVPADQAQAYAAAGAAAISVLTESSRFAGSLDDLRDVVARVDKVPVMRKDFLVDPYQVLEARAAGAGGLLIIAAILEPRVLEDMLDLTLDLGMFALIEAFDDDDLERCGPVIERFSAESDERSQRILLGINCRNLRTLEVEFGRFAQLAGRLPAGVPWVAESGVTTPNEAAAVAACGYQLALVGTALMRADNPSSAVNALLDAGRRVMAR